MKIQKTIGAGVLSLGLLVGLSGYDAGATSRSIGHTGAHSYNKIKTEVRKNVRINNTNDIRVNNDNYQRAYTGDAEVRYNTTGGGAYTGDATNRNSLDVSATVDNSGSAGAWAGAVKHSGGGAGGASIDSTGYDSTNVIKHVETTRVNVTNNNDIRVNNDNNQTASSGDATVKGNTTGGDAVSGDATNTNSTSVTLNIKN